MLTRVEDLVAFLVQSRRCSLASDGDDGCSVHVGVRDSRDQICRTRPERRHAHAGAPGQAPVHVGHERGALLVVSGDEFDGAVQQCIHHVDVLFAGNAEDVLDTFVFQALDEQFSGLH
jgi:hypothetical protein